MLLMFLYILNFHSLAMATDTPFTVSVILLKPLAISQVKSLAFPSTNIGISTDLVVHSTDDNAAQFQLVGSANTNIISTVVESSISVAAPGVSKQVIVDSFTVNAPLALNDKGKGTVGVGGTAHINQDSEDGNYMGSATLRITYQ